MLIQLDLTLVVSVGPFFKPPNLKQKNYFVDEMAKENAGNQMQMGNKSTRVGKWRKSTLCKCLNATQPAEKTSKERKSELGSFS